MRWNHGRLLYGLILAWHLIIPCRAAAMDVNEFYRRFVADLKASRHDLMERLVRQNPAEARKSLAIVSGKRDAEQDTGRRGGLNMLAVELEELLAVTGGRKNCEMAARIVDRGTGTVIPEEALEAFRRALRLCPDSLDANLGFADVNKRMGQFEGALSGYEKALAIQKDSPAALLGMGEVMYSAGLYERGAPYLESLLKVTPDNTKAKKLLESCTKQIAADREGILSSQEIVDRLWAPLEGNLMCMCPVHLQLIARVRFRSITFNADSAWLDAESRQQLAQLAEALKTDALKGGRYLIEGHADPSGDADYNVGLSARRAEAVKRYLIESLRVDPKILSASGMGSARSLTLYDTLEGKRTNRRIEVIAIGDKDKAAAQKAAP